MLRMIDTTGNDASDERLNLHFGAVVQLPLASIDEPPGERASRRYYDPAALEELAASLIRHGLLQPICVRPAAADRFEIVFGTRRLRAARLAGWTTIAAHVRVDEDDAQTFLLGLVENLQRRDLSGAERVQGLRMLGALHQPGTQPGGRGRGAGKLEPPEEQPFSFNGLARRLSVSQPTVARWVKLANDPTLLAAVEAGEVPMTTASFIAAAPSEARADLLDELRRGELAPGQVRDRVRALSRVHRSRSAGPARFGDASATSRILKGVLAELDLVVAIATEEERRLLEQVADRIVQLRSGERP
jgi:ParB-like chromosome segregation protein Spo0J